jgi:cell wall-associated NlpC family hydrolase
MLLNRTARILGAGKLSQGAALLVLLAAACATTAEIQRPLETSSGEPSYTGEAVAPPSAASPPGASVDPPAAPADERTPPSRPSVTYDDRLGARLVRRATSALGHRKAFTVGAERLPGDCSGYVSWVYETEGIPLRQLMMRAAPDESSGVAASYAVARSFGVVFGGGGEWPRPGDMVFFRDTYDRNHNGRFDDPFTHMGIVESVDEGGTVAFLHRGSRGVARGYLTFSRASERRDESGRELNSILRKGRTPSDGSTLAGRLFMGYGRIDLARLPAQSVARR